MRHKQFGASSEKGSSTQENLFNESELEALNADSKDDAPIEEKGDTSKPAIKRTSGRKPLSAELPRIRVEHDLNESDDDTDRRRMQRAAGDHSSQSAGDPEYPFQIRLQAL